MLRRLRVLAAVLLLPAAAILAVLAPAGASTPPAVTHVTGFRAVSLPNLPHTHLPEHLVTHAANGSATSGNWAGYAAVACPTCHLRYAETSFTVPSVNCPASTIGASGFAYVSHWVGLDGFTNGTVEQTGVAGYCTSATTPATYYAWYEMYPLPPVAFTGVAPGDAITASVYFNGTGYQLHLTDITTGSVIATTQPCPAGQTCQHTNAEVITEDPGGAVAGGYDLADFGQANYLGSKVTSLAGVHGGYGPANGYWAPYAITMVNGADIMASPGATEGGAAFPVTWRAGT